ncbi:MAG: arginyltransferase [Pseudomonadales bacterium]
MTVLSKIKIFATYPHECSYLENQEATTLFVDPGADIDSSAYARLSELGFRRSGTHLYRPHCKDCKACVPARIPVALFEPNRRQRRITRKNKDLTTELLENINSDEYFDLYHRYICARHQDGDMYPPTREQYDSFLNCEWQSTRFIVFKSEGKPVAVSVVDEMDNGLSAVYTFFDPDEPKRSLGAFAILWQIQYTQALQLPALYLGYWIKQCAKMSYKTEYRPLEMYVNDEWALLN